jgi:hypothetical protein
MRYLNNPQVIKYQMKNCKSKLCKKKKPFGKNKKICKSLKKNK